MTETLTREEALADFVRETQAADWHDLLEDLRRAINGVWSIAASGTAVRIVAAARLVGITPWESVPIDLVFGGIYEAVCEAGGVECDPPTEAEQRDTLEMFNRERPRILPPSEERERWAATVAKIRSPREAAYIRNGAE